MRLPLLFTGLVLAAPAALAQTAISIAASDMPTVGDTLRLSQAISLPASAPALTLAGANKTWNYAGLTPTSQRVDKYQAVSAATGPLLQYTFNNALLNPDNKATVVSPGGLPAAVAQQLPITDPWQFYNASTADYRSVGYGGTLSGTAIPVTYATKPQQDIIYTFPLTYGNAAVVSQSLLTTPATLAATGYFSQRRQRTTLVDGWGTLTTPFGTYQALRVLVTIIDHDSVALGGAAGQGSTLPTRRDYIWLAKNVHVPLLTITTSEVAGTQQVTAVEYRDIYRKITPLASHGAALEAGLDFYPNPSAAGQPLRLAVPAGTGPLTVQATDVVGRRLGYWRFAGDSGEVVLDAASLGNYRGLLLLTLQTSQGTATRRVVRQ